MHRACYLGQVRLLWSGAAPGALAFAVGCAGGNEAYVRAQGAADMSCQPEQTVIVDSEVGLYRVQGCGQEAGYRCPEIGNHCRRMYLKPLPEPAADAGARGGPSGEAL
jgi:hypothetical protein